MKKEIVVATAITALLTSLSAEKNPVNLDKLSVDSNGKINLLKNLQGKVDSNKEIAKGDHDKWNICVNACSAKDKDKIGHIDKGKIGHIDKGKIGHIDKGKIGHIDKRP